MLPLLLILAAGPETAIEAERAFNRAAQTDGQWTAFRAFMAPDALVFTPQPAKAAEALPAKDPRIAVQWWPAESYVSCDGSVAVNTGPWVRPNASGYFTTVWERQADGHYKWRVDGGDALASPRALPETPKVRRAACRLPSQDKAVASLGPAYAKFDEGRSADGTLTWSWVVTPDGARMFVARLWNGRSFETVITDKIAAPAP